MHLKENIQQAEVLQSTLIGYHLGNWNTFSVKEVYSNTDKHIYLDSLNTVSHQMMIHISTKAFSSNPNLFAFGSDKIYKTYSFLHLSELGEGRKGRKTAKFRKRSLLATTSSTTANSHNNPCKRHQQLGGQPQNYWTYPAFQKNFLATCVPIIHHLWPYCHMQQHTCGAKHLALSWSKGTSQLKGVRGSSVSKQKQRPWWQERNIQAELTADRNRGKHQLCLVCHIVKLSEYNPTTQL